jgi:hypothetical protein
MEIVLQGPLYPNTINVANHYLQLDFVEKIIISTWKPEQDFNFENIEFVFSEEPYNESPGNMNLQIVSSLNGLLKTKSDIVAKMRGDQKISLESMIRLHNFFVQNNNNEIKYYDSSGPVGPIFVIGMNSIFPFHPQDHVFWGHREDVVKLFELPLMTPEIWRVGNDFKVELRDAIYLGAHYYKHFNPIVQNYIDDHKKYLTDAAPMRNEAMNTYNEIRDKVFKVFPRIDMWWEKYNCSYLYDGYSKQGEYYAD